MSFLSQSFSDSVDFFIHQWSGLKVWSGTKMPKNKYMLNCQPWDFWEKKGSKQKQNSHHVYQHFWQKLISFSICTSFWCIFSYLKTLFMIPAVSKPWATHESASFFFYFGRVDSWQVCLLKHHHWVCVCIIPAWCSTRKWATSVSRGFSNQNVVPLCLQDHPILSLQFLCFG